MAKLKDKTFTDYDEDADMLYISFSKPKIAVTIDGNNGELIRIDPYTKEIVGVTIIDFKQRYTDLLLERK